MCHTQDFPAGREASAIPEDHRCTHSVIDVDHPAIASADATKARSKRLVDFDQPFGEVSCSATEMP